jgi:23S rRNA (adenine2503-C2)-methyltransferase
MELGNSRGTWEAQPPFAKQLYKPSIASGFKLKDVTTMPAALRRELETLYRGPAATGSRFESIDGTRRYLLRLSDGRTIEAVLMPEEHDTICISTQVGCRSIASSAALMGLERNLTAGDRRASALCSER